MHKHLAVVLATAMTAAGLGAGTAHADREIVVQPGDSMQSISLRYYGDTDHVWTIASYNHLPSPDLIYVGLTLVLPDLPGDTQSTSTTGGDAHGPAISARDSGPLTGDAEPPVPFAMNTTRPNAVALPVLLGPTSPEASPGPVPRVASGATATADAAVPGVAIETGMATWYGPGFDGNFTFCGDVFQEWGYTAASNTLPCGTEVVVTNQDTGASVSVRVNDRGGFGGSLIMDLSRGAFNALAPESFGVIPVVISLPAR